MLLVYDQLEKTQFRLGKLASLIYRVVGYSYVLLLLVLSRFLRQFPEFWVAALAVVVLIFAGILGLLIGKSMFLHLFGARIGPTENRSLETLENDNGPNKEI